MTLFSGTIIVLCGSVLLNIFLIWFIINALKQIRSDQIQISNLIEELEEVQNIIRIYVDHLHAVGELEMFYGDETLRELMRHGKAVVDAFKEYGELYFPILEQSEESEEWGNESDNNNIEENIGESSEEETRPYHTTE